jgi:hypothetical protein
MFMRLASPQPPRGQRFMHMRRNRLIIVGRIRDDAVQHIEEPARFNVAAQIPLAPTCIVGQTIARTPD